MGGNKCLNVEMACELLDTCSCCQLSNQNCPGLAWVPTLAAVPRNTGPVLSHPVLLSTVQTQNKDHPYAKCLAEDGPAHGTTKATHPQSL